ncbi:MAG TPA: VanZ family protein [Usitatibacteraceae bacterium]|nr:VanZ family protein [Usitatibacteraceae bacterium]
MMRSVFRAAAIGIVLTIWVLSLIPINQAVPGSDKLHHLAAYFACMWTWAQVYAENRMRLRLAGAIVLMGAMVECVQWLVPWRSFDWADMLANALGVALAYFVAAGQAILARRMQARTS